MSTTLQDVKRKNSSRLSHSPAQRLDQLSNTKPFDFGFDLRIPIPAAAVSPPRFEIMVKNDRPRGSSDICDFPPFYLDEFPTIIPWRRHQKTEGRENAEQPSRGLGQAMVAARPVAIAPQLDRGRCSRLNQCVAVPAEEVRKQNVERRLENIERRLDRFEKKQKKSMRGSQSRRPKRSGGRGRKIDIDYWLDRWERDFMDELHEEGYTKKETRELVNERVLSLSSVQAAVEINRRYRHTNKGESVISASSIRRRKPNVGGGCGSSKGPFVSRRWAEWEPYRKASIPEDRLTEGSLDNDADEDCGEPPQDAAKMGGSQTEGDEGLRRRSIYDGGLASVNIGQACEEEIRNGRLTRHVGGVGSSRLRDAANQEEKDSDRLCIDADKFLAEHGHDPQGRRLESQKGTGVYPITADQLT